MDQQNHPSIDLNAASVRDLAGLPGVDRLMARRIVFDRKLNGTFRSVEDLARVEGINPVFIANVGRYLNVELEYQVAPARLTLDSAKTESAESADLTFWGTPDYVRGTVPLRNEGGATLHTVSLGIDSQDLKTYHGVRLERLQAVCAIAPGQGANVAFTVQLDPRTPKGVYKAELIAGQERWPATFYVVEHTAATVAPSRYMLSSVPGAKTERQLVVHNDGNTSITIGDLGPVVVEDRDLGCRVLRDTVRRLEKPSADDFIAAASNELKKSFAQIEPMKIRTKNKPVTVAPGDTAVLELEIQNPKNTRRGRHYLAQLRFFNATLTIELMPGWAEEEDT